MRLKNILAVLGVAVSLFIFSGCQTKPPKSISEIMQQPKNSDYYLAYNIWTDGKFKISSINYQVRLIIPFGTKVRVKKVTSKAITFTVLSTGEEYTIVYKDQYGLKPIEAFIRTLLTKKNGDQLAKGIPASDVAMIKRGDIRRGMSKREVILAYGPPSPHRTPSLENATWVYWLRRYPVSLTLRVIFKGDKVLEVLR